VPFDVHGDRQCQMQLSGTDCLIRAFPSGYGIRLTDPMRTFYDLNDVRHAGSSTLEFYSEHMYRWTRIARRTMGRLDTTIPANVAGHDDYLLIFHPEQCEEYLVWAELTFMGSATIRHIFWHTHHEFTTDMWVASAAASDLGLGQEPFQKHHVLLNSFGLSIPDTMHFVLDSLAKAQDSCEQGKRCTTVPRMRCSINKQRWELVDDERVERYHAPHCNSPWEYNQGDVFTLVSFHKAQMHMVAAQSVWMHTVLYAYYTASNESTLAPQAMLAYPTDLMTTWDSFLQSGYAVRYY